MKGLSRRGCARRFLRLVVLFAATLMPQAAAWAAEFLPRPLAPFAGRLGPTEADSSPAWPEPVRPPPGAPNILLIVTDDVGFAAASPFGGLVPTPNLERLAARGLRYTRFHTTGICSSTRAALLTGRNHHAVGNGTLVDIPSPYPGYSGRIPPSAATVARILRDHGYNTAMFGKDHNVPQEDRSPAGPFDQWPMARGFEYFFGFVHGDTDQFRPALYRNNWPVEEGARREGFLLDEQLADEAIRWLHNQQAAAPGKPFFLYYSTGSAHAPHQAPPEWIARFRGRYDAGWDAMREAVFARQKALGIAPAEARLAPRPVEIPAWDDLSPAERRVAARYMEVYAAQLAFQDAQVGRLLDELERMDLAENTLVIFVQGDNGGSAEGGPEGSINEMAHLSGGEHLADAEWLAAHLDELGGPRTYEIFPAGWGFATNTPFPWFKQIASHLGATRNGLIIAWPAKIAAGGGIRAQYHHVIDLMPTILEAAGIEPPRMVDGIAQMPIHGVSMVYSFADPARPSPRRTQYYEIMGNRALYHDGWLAATRPRNMPWNMPRQRGGDVTAYEWELYHLERDFSQTENLAARFPDKLAELQALFDAEARRYQVYPIHDSGGHERGQRAALAPGRALRSHWTFWGGGVSLPVALAPPIFQLPFTLEAILVVPEGGARGVIAAAGSHFGGWSFFLTADGRPAAHASLAGLPIPGAQGRVEAEAPLPPGRHRLRYTFEPEGAGGVLAIAVDDREVAHGAVARRPPILAGNGETFDTGRDTNVPVTPEHADGGPLQARLEKVEVEVKLPLPGRALEWLRR
ncbi:MAG: arylsulfatase [Porticoccaceae bacterium]|nr:MAG: arylsulfatase [Porticoccaceae bacterium]